MPPESAPSAQDAARAGTWPPAVAPAGRVWRLRLPDGWLAWGMRTIHLGLAGAAAAATTWLAWMLVTPVAALPAGVMAPAVTTAAPAEAWPSLASAATRPLFAAQDRASAAADVPSSTVGGLNGSWNLLGIIPGSPAQAIVEDAQTKKTYVVQPGERLAGGWVVERIAEDRLILDAQGATVELSL